MSGVAQFHIVAVPGHQRTQNLGGFVVRGDVPASRQPCPVLAQTIPQAERPCLPRPPADDQAPVGIDDGIRRERRVEEEVVVAIQEYVRQPSIRQSTLSSVKELKVGIASS